MQETMTDGGGTAQLEHERSFTKTQKRFGIGCAEKRRWRAGGVEIRKRNRERNRLLDL